MNLRLPATCLFLLSPCLPMHAAPADPASQDAPWSEPYFQYRIPLETVAGEPGWNLLRFSPRDLTGRINAIEAFQYDPDFVATNYVKLVEVDAQGHVLNDHTEAGYYLVPKGKNFAAEALASPVPDKVSIHVVPGKPHLMEYVSSGGGKSPANGYETVFEPHHPLRKHDFKISFFPPLLPLKKEKHEVLFIPDRDSMDLAVGGPRAPHFETIRVREAEIAFLANLDRPGKKRWFLYYQPMGSHHLQIPAKRQTEIPAREMEITGIEKAESHAPGLRYTVAASKDAVLSYADSTVKLIRDLPLPKETRSGIALASAANESISFQIFITPKNAIPFRSATASPLANGRDSIPGSAIHIHRIEYIPITKSSYISPARYLGDIGDALVPADPTPMEPKNGPLGLWITIDVPPGAPHGTYRGTVSIQAGERTEQIPVSLQVHDFALPEYSPLQTSMGGQYFTKVIQFKSGDSKTISDFHGVHSPDDLRALARKYYDVMAANKFNPKTVALLEEIGMNWTPPPHGYNVDAEGNFFELKDWDFTKFNACLRHFIDERKVNTVCIYHTNPMASNLFRQLPGKRLSRPYPHPGHVTMAWQTFRETTTVAYGKIPDNLKNSVIEITPGQWDDLVLKYFRRIAEDLQENGWLDKAMILIDEQPNPERLEHFLKLLKSDALTARLKTVMCIQSLGEVTAAAPGGAPGSRFRDLIGSYAPEMDENYDRWMDYYADDYGISKDRRKLWFYIVYTSRHAIDTPGINNRAIGLDIFRRGGSGLLYWESFNWDNPYRDAANPEKNRGGNPWKNPYLRHSNGALAFFYPPRRDDSLPTAPDFTVTPSLRIEAFRQSINDYEYAWLLEGLAGKAEKKGIDATAARRVLREIGEFYPTNTDWSQNAWWYLELRKKMAEAIVELKHRLEGSQG